MVPIMIAGRSESPRVTGALPVAESMLRSVLSALVLLIDIIVVVLCGERRSFGNRPVEAS
jgi:hypothetical protein